MGPNVVIYAAFRANVADPPPCNSWTPPPHPSYTRVFWRNLKSCLAKRQKELDLYELLSFTYQTCVTRVYHTTNVLHLALGLGMN